ncbi:MAG: RNA 2',3'-cyclic phosphodiesterase [Candidatus Margulisiibacteriota bacterium]
MRVFVAIKAPDNIRSFVLQIQRSIPLNVRWIPPENLHVTLLPPWEADELETEAIVQKLMKIDLPKISTRFKSVSFGPSLKEPRLIWLAAHPSKELAALKSCIETALEIKCPERDFTPHITIARFKPGDFTKFNIKDLNIDIDWNMEIGSFALIRSMLTKEGAIYSTIKEIG